MKVGIRKYQQELDFFLRFFFVYIVKTLFLITVMISLMVVRPENYLKRLVFPKKFSSGKFVSRHFGSYLLLYLEKFHDFTEYEPLVM